jgi:hypothetical protein
LAVVESNRHGATERWIADAHRGAGKRFLVHADEKLTAFVELDSAIRPKCDGSFSQTDNFLEKRLQTSQHATLRGPT